PEEALLHRILAGLLVIFRHVAVVHLECEQTHARRAEATTAATEPAGFRIPTPAVGWVADLKAQQPVRQAAGALAVRSHGPLVPLLPLFSAVETDDLRRVIVVVHVAE